MSKTNINIKTFDTWAKKGKDEGMQIGHTPAVERMLEILKNQTNSTNQKFSFLDVGCGNGWVVRKLLKHPNCTSSIGIDGSSSMIEKAQYKSSKSKYVCADIETWVCRSKFSIAFSMETFYYFSNPGLVLKNIYRNLLIDGGVFILGVDHYKENKSTLDWDSQFNIKTTTLEIKEWKNIFSDAGFSDVYVEQYNAKKDWSGTLIIMGVKKYVV